MNIEIRNREGRRIKRIQKIEWRMGEGEVLGECMREKLNRKKK